MLDICPDVLLVNQHVKKEVSPWWHSDNWPSWTRTYSYGQQL